MQAAIFLLIMDEKANQLNYEKARFSIPLIESFFFVSSWKCVILRKTIAREMLLKRV